MEKWKATFKYSNANSDTTCVEFDEVMVAGKRKHERGRKGEEIWCIMCRQRRTGIMCGDYVRSRDASTCEATVMKYVSVGDVVMVDGWKGYNNVPAHGVICWSNPHKHSFVDWMLVQIHKPIFFFLYFFGPNYYNNLVNYTNNL